MNKENRASNFFIALSTENTTEFRFKGIYLQKAETLRKSFVNS